MPVNGKDAEYLDSICSCSLETTGASRESKMGKLRRHVDESAPTCGGAHLNAGVRVCQEV